MIYVPKLRKEIERLLNLTSQNWIELQLITAFMYVKTSLTIDAKNILSANHEWVFFNFLNSFYENIIDDNTNSMNIDYWSKNAFKNVFTITIWIILYGIFYLILIIGFKKSFVLSFFQFEIGQQFMKIFVFTIGISLFIEINNIFNGISASANSWIIYFYGVLFLIVYPLGKIIYLRLKHRGKLDLPSIFLIFGRDYRDYQKNFREFHMLFEQFLQLFIAGVLIFVNNYEEPQLFLMLSGLILFCMYSVLIKPYYSMILNLESWFSRGLLTIMIGIILASRYYSSQAVLNYGLLISLILWYLEKLLFTTFNIFSALKTVKLLLVRDLSSDNSPPNLINEENPTDIYKKKRFSKLEKLKKNNSIDDEHTFIIPDSPVKDEIFEIDRQATGSTLIEQKNETKNIGDSSADDIDPRFLRKRSSKKIRTVGKVYN